MEEEGRKILSFLKATKLENRRIRDALLMQLGEQEARSRKDLANLCLVGRWVEDFEPHIRDVRKWGSCLWNL